MECKHGQLTRNCNICEYEQEINQLRNELSNTVGVDTYESLLRYADQLTAENAVLREILENLHHEFVNGQIFSSSFEFPDDTTAEKQAEKMLKVVEAAVVSIEADLDCYEAQCEAHYLLHEAVRDYLKEVSA